jgi:hypothetical protein
MDNILILIFILLGAGIFGGIVGYFRIDYDKIIEPREMIKPILIGTGASLLVPLFLNMMSSDLIENSKSNPYAYFIILGFGLIASIFSNDFISALGKKILNELKDVKKEVENSNTEDDVITLKNDFEFKGLVNSQESDILIAFKNNSYTFRSITGLANQTGLDKITIQGLLNGLVDKNIIEVVQRGKGPRWKLTSQGYNCLARIIKHESTGPTGSP